MKKKIMCFFTLVMGLIVISFSQKNVYANEEYGEVVDSGSCGADTTYVLYDSGTLVVSGSGEMEAYAFIGNSNIKSVIVNDGITSIGFSTFHSCSGLSSIIIPNSVVSIEIYAFSQCSSLTSIELPSGLTSIGNGVFRNCTNLEKIEVDKNNMYYSSIDGILYNKEQTEIIYCPKGINKDVIIPEGVTSIGNSAFFGCSRLTSITLPSGLTSLGDCTFSHCSSLTSIELPSGLTSIGNCVFLDCSSLKSIFLPSGLISIGNDESYGYFFGCTSLEKIEVDKDNMYYSSIDGILCNKEQTEIIKCPAGRNKDVIIPEGIKSIGERAFWGCSSLTSIELPSGITSIGKNAFYGCSELKAYVYSESYAEAYVIVYYIPFEVINKAGWKQNATGWWYDNGDETYPKSTWKSIDGSWYYFEGNGYMVTGWLKDGGNWYYLESNGKMAANKWIQGTYYVKSNGAMAVSEWVDGGIYYVDSNGKWVPNKTKATWKKDKKGWWYDNGDETYPKSTWKSIDGSWYYFEGNGYMVTGWLKDGGNWYYLELNGKMAANKWVDGGRYYVDVDGRWVA